MWEEKDMNVEKGKVILKLESRCMVWRMYVEICLDFSEF